jgi:polyferredoxin
MTESHTVIEKRGKKKIRKGQPIGPWVTARKTVQYSTLLFFIVLFIFSQRDGWPGILVNIPMRLDPLLMLAQLLASRTFLAGSTLALIILLLSLVFGRAWCGWICPLGTTLDLFPLRSRNQRTKQKPPAEAWRTVKFTLLFIILLAALFGNLTLLFFDPLTIFPSNAPFPQPRSRTWPLTLARQSRATSTNGPCCATIACSEVNPLST